MLLENLNNSLPDDDALEDFIPDARAVFGFETASSMAMIRRDDTVIWDLAQNYVPRIKMQIEAALDENA